MEVHPHLRREFLKRASALGAAAIVGLGPKDVTAGALANPVGYATISWPEEQFEHALETVSALGFKGVQVVGWVRERYGKRAVALQERLQTLGLKPVALSCWDVALDPENAKEDVAQLRSYAAFFQSLGGLFLQVTDGGKPNGDYSNTTIRQLGARMNELGRIAQDHSLALGYHPHMGSIGETQEGAARLLDATDARWVKLIADVGHLTLGGMDPAKVIRTYGERLILTHFKDVRPDAAELARTSRAAVRDRKFVFCEIGTGLVDFASVAAALRAIHYKGWIIVELDSNEPAPGGPDASARANRDAIRNLGFTM